MCTNCIDTMMWVFLAIIIALGAVRLFFSAKITWSHPQELATSQWGTKDTDIRHLFTNLFVLKIMWISCSIVLNFGSTFLRYRSILYARYFELFFSIYIILQNYVCNSKYFMSTEYRPIRGKISTAKGKEKLYMFCLGGGAACFMRWKLKSGNVNEEYVVWEILK